MVVKAKVMEIKIQDGESFSAHGNKFHVLAP